MGTSNIFRGNKDKNPLLPLDYVEQDHQESHLVTWKTAKTVMSKYVASGGTQGTAKHVIQQAIRANGGSHKMTRSAISGVRAASAIGSFFVGIREQGISTTLQQLGIQYEGRSVVEIFSKLINIVTPAAETKEDIVAREASQAALSNVYEYVSDNNMDLSCLDHMAIELMDKAMKSFFTEYIWGSIMKDLESRIEQYMNDVSSAFEREQELKDTIEAVVDVEYDKSESLLHGNINDAVITLTERCLGILEGIL